MLFRRAHGAQRFHVLDLVPIEEEEDSPYVGLLRVEPANALAALVHQVGDLGELDLVDGLMYARTSPTS